MMAGAPGQVSCGWSWHIVILLAPHWPKSVCVCVRVEAGWVLYACVHVGRRWQSHSAKDMDTEGARNGDR